MRREEGGMMMGGKRMEEGRREGVTGWEEEEGRRLKRERDAKNFASF